MVHATAFRGLRLNQRVVSLLANLQMADFGNGGPKPVTNRPTLTQAGIKGPSAIGLEVRQLPPIHKDLQKHPPEVINAATRNIHSEEIIRTLQLAEIQTHKVMLLQG